MARPVEAPSEPTRPYRMVRRAAATERTRQRILDATIERVDPAEMTIAAVAAEAGVTSRTVLRHFGSRTGLLEAAIEEGNTRVEEERFAIEPGDVEGAVENLVDHYELRAEGVLARLAEGVRNEEIEEINESGRKLHRRWVAEAFAPRLEGLDRATRRRRHAQLVAICDVYTYKLLRRDLGLGPDHTKTAIVEMIRGLTEGEPR